MDVGESGLQTLRKRAEPHRAGSHPGNPGYSSKNTKCPFLLEAVEPHEAETLTELAVPQLCLLRVAKRPLPGPLLSPPGFHKPVIFAFHRNK